MKLAINDKITWVSAAGRLTGTIKNIVLSENAADQTIPWIDITDISDVNTNKRHSNTRLCANHNYLLQMKVALA